MRGPLGSWIPAFAGMTIERGTRQFLFVTLTKVRVQLGASERMKLDSGFRRNDEGGDASCADL